jgi:hypothetical protein
MPTFEPAIYQLKVVLQGISPRIWRRLQIRGDRTIADGEWYPIFDPGDEKLPLIAQLPRFFHSRNPGTKMQIKADMADDESGQLQLGQKFEHRVIVCPLLFQLLFYFHFLFLRSHL